MIDITSQQLPAMNKIQNKGTSKAINVKPEQDHDSQPILKMKKNARMGGSTPVWEKPTTEQEKINQRLNMAGEKSYESAIGTAAFAGNDTAQSSKSGEPFGFDDLVDMINPLHHIPVIGHVYRETSGDDIRGFSKIMGGAVFGGAAGAAGSVVNVAVEEETGRDLLGNAQMAFLQDPALNKPDRIRTPNQYAAYQMNAIEPGARDTGPQRQQEFDKEDLQSLGREYVNRSGEFFGASVAVTDLKLSEDTIYKRVDAGDRMAGTVAHEVNRIRDILPPREAITDFSLTR